MAEWLYEAGIGECRAALVVRGRILAAAIEPEGTLHVGAVLPARLVAAHERRVVLAGGQELLLDQPVAQGEGHPLRVEISREPIPERGRLRPALGRVTAAAVREGADLLARVAADGLPVRRLPAHGPDLLEEAGWSELLEEARTGDIAFAGGIVRLDCTRAMTLFDIDLADRDRLGAALETVAGAIRRHGVGGSIGIDLPVTGGRAERQAQDRALDRALADAAVGPHERTAINGFGFVQLILPRPRASLPERLRHDPAAPLRAALRRLERDPPPHGAPLPLPPALLAELARRPRWVAELEARSGRRFAR